METQSAFMGAAAAAVLLVAILVRRRDRAALLFASLTLAYGLWALGRGGSSLGYAAAEHLADLALCAIGPLAVASARALSRRGAQLGRYAPLLLLGSLLIVGAVLIAGDRPAVHTAAHLWAFLGVFSGALMLARFAPPPDAEPSPEFTRLHYLAIAHALVVGAALLDALRWKLDAPRVGALLAPLLYLYAGYLHLAQVRVADLRQLLANAVALAVMASGLAALFAAIRIWVGEDLDTYVFNAFVASFALLLLYEPIRDRIQSAMDRRFVAGRLELERGLRPLCERLSHALTLDELLEDLLATLERTDRLRASSIFLCDDPNLGFQQAGSIGLPPRTRVSLIRNPVWVDALQESDALLHEELAREIDETHDEGPLAKLELLRGTMRDLDAQLVLPLRAESQLVGFWTLTDARPEEPFSTDEVRFLREVADHLSVSIETSKTFERIRVRDRLVSLGEMSAGLAHEIRNPLATIRGALAVLEDPEDAQQNELHGVIVEEIQKLDRVVESFLDYARPTERRKPIADLAEFVRSCSRAVARQKARGDVVLTLDIDDELPLVNLGQDQLERVLVNIIQNAYEALSEGGQLQISARGGGGALPHAPFVEIAVEDDGPGMDDATLERAFVPFFTTKDSGTGLGLALCERLLRSQGGSIELRSRSGEGTSVVIRLPAESEAEPEADEPETAA